MVKLQPVAQGLDIMRLQSKGNKIGITALAGPSDRFQVLCAKVFPFSATPLIDEVQKRTLLPFVC